MACRTSSSSSSTSMDQSSSGPPPSPSYTDENKEKLIRLLKKEVKMMMEESVTLKTIHEDSSTVTSLCAVVDTCLSMGLKRRALGLFKTSSTTALMQKLYKENEDVEFVMKRVSAIEQEIAEQNRRTHSVGDSTGYSSLKTRSYPLEKTNSGSNLSLSYTRYRWIRVALFEKKLQKIVDNLVDNADRFYSKDSLIADRDYGPIISNLLVGPCALEYSKVMSSDHSWTELPAKELVQRHRIASGCLSSPSSYQNISSPSHVVLHAKRSLSHTSSAISDEERRSVPLQAREYVESLHQNNHNALLYGKNNVVVMPKDGNVPVPGYLSLHKNSPGSFSLKWTPNKLMNAGLGGEDKKASWQSAITVDIHDIIFLHCHQDQDESGMLVMVANDGTQHPPFQFPPGGHLLQFISCFESSIAPYGSIVPPFWLATQPDSADYKSSSTDDGSSVFSTPKSRRILPLLRRNKEIDDSRDEPSPPESTLSSSKDYLFKVVMKDSHHHSPSVKRPRSTTSHEKARRTTSFLCLGGVSQHSGGAPLSAPILGGNDYKNGFLSSRKDGSDLKSKSEYWFSNLFSSPSKYQDSERSRSLASEPSSDTSRTLGDTSGTFETIGEEASLKQFTPSEPISNLCNTMRRQIISRAFYGWLSHVRYLKTVREHLNGLVLENKVSHFPESYYESGLQPDEWNAFLRGDRTNEEIQDLYQKVYCGGVEVELRPEVWPYLLGLYSWKQSDEDKQKLDAKIRKDYEYKLSNWMAIDAIVKQRDKEITAANIAKLAASSGQNNRNSVAWNGSANDVFESSEEEGQDGEDAIDHMSSRTVSADKISTITEVTENSTSNSEKSRGKLLSTQSEPGYSGGGGRAAHLDEGIVDDASAPSNEDCGLIMTAPSIENDAASVINCRVTRQSVDSGNAESASPTPILKEGASLGNLPAASDELKSLTQKIAGLNREDTISLSSACQSPVSSEEGVVSQELVDNFGINLHRIDKDVLRCDRNLSYFNMENLEKLRNVITTYVWDNLDVGYMQGMCDIVAPLLVIFDDEPMTHSCFSLLMERMINNFPQGPQMDENFLNMKSLIQVLDPVLYDKIQENEDFSHFYFCYRWFLLDFKREFTYNDVYSVWETIWASPKVASGRFYLFVALALVDNYRDIILDQNMDFTDIIKFFNEMAEKHDGKRILSIAREQVSRLQQIIVDENNA